MRTIAILCRQEEINREIETICKDFADEFTPVFLKDEASFVQVLNYEFPEIDIINFTDPEINTKETLELIKNDPWLHFGGSIVLYQKETEKEVLSQLTGVNIIALIHIQWLATYLPRILRVLSQNRGIIFQRDIHALLQSNISGQFVIDNDPFDAATYSNLLANFLYNSNLINLDQKDGFNSAMMELLINAIEHGNCKISYEEKRDHLMQGRDILELIRDKNADPEIAQKKVHLNYKISPTRSAFIIRDEGEGFDWRGRLNDGPSPEKIEESLGRGILMARHYLLNLRYNEEGTEVWFELEHDEHESNIIPPVFKQYEEVTFKDGEMIFRQGEASSHLYYIISGRFEVIANGKKVSTLTSADIFLGEMSFLLSNKRSATVVARGKGVLIQISKEDFINSIKEQPHYGVFLARLLAQRLDQLHDLTI